MRGANLPRCGRTEPGYSDITMHRQTHLAHYKGIPNKTYDYSFSPTHLT